MTTLTWDRWIEQQRDWQKKQSVEAVPDLKEDYVIPEFDFENLEIFRNDQAFPVQEQFDNQGKEKSLKAFHTGIEKDSGVIFLNKPQLEEFKAGHPMAQFMEVPEKDVKIMDKNQIKRFFPTETPNVLLLNKKKLEEFKKQHPQDTFIHVENESPIFTPGKNLQIIKRKQPDLPKWIELGGKLIKVEEIGKDG